MSLRKKHQKNSQHSGVLLFEYLRDSIIGESDVDDVEERHDLLFKIGRTKGAMDTFNTALQLMDEQIKVEKKNDLNLRDEYVRAKRLHIAKEMSDSKFNDFMCSLPRRQAKVSYTILRLEDISSEITAAIKKVEMAAKAKEIVKMAGCKM